MTEEKLAIMKNVGIGLRDTNTPMLWFNTFVSEGSTALQCLGWEDAFELIKAAGCTEVKHLEGKPCWVIDEGHTIRFLRIAKI